MNTPRPTFDVYQSTTDGIWVVHIETDGITENAEGPIMRVYMNDDTDDPLWANPPLPEVPAS